MPKVYIVGVGNDGAASLGQEALDLIHHAHLLCGGQRLLDYFPEGQAQKAPVNSNLGQLAQLIRERLVTDRIVVLASGDPNFYGIAKFLIGAFGKDSIEIIPNVSSMQLAFARIKESWEDAALASVHGRSTEEIIDLVRCNRKTAILTDGQRTPWEIAGAMLAQGLTGYRAFVCENLGGEDERVIEADLAELVGRQVSPLNVLILLKAQREEPEEKPISVGRWSLGIPDDEFFQRRPLRGLITKGEVRVVSLSRMGLREDSVVWDVGAGSGSVSVEAALIARRGQVYAVERSAADASMVEKNLRKFGVANAVLVRAEALEALAPLPEPDVVFIGGSGGRMEEILEVACHRLKPGGRLVANIATIANLDSAVRGLMARGFDVNVTLVNIARSKQASGLSRVKAGGRAPQPFGPAAHRSKSTDSLLRFEALDPVFVVSAERPACPE